MLLLVSTALAASKLERLDLGLAGNLRVGSPEGAIHPVELSVTSFVLPWLGFTGRVGLGPQWSSIYSVPYPESADLRGETMAGVRFGKNRGIYGIVGVQAYLPPPGRYVGRGDVDIVPEAIGGWRFGLTKDLTVAPELLVGTVYVGAGVHFELRVI